MIFSLDKVKLWLGMCIAVGSFNAVLSVFDGKEALINSFSLNQEKVVDTCNLVSLKCIIELSGEKKKKLISEGEIKFPHSEYWPKKKQNTSPNRLHTVMHYRKGVRVRGLHPNMLRG